MREDDIFSNNIIERINKQINNKKKWQRYKIDIEAMTD
jgi:hypothetical protein